MNPPNSTLISCSNNKNYLSLRILLFQTLIVDLLQRIWFATTIQTKFRNRTKKFPFSQLTRRIKSNKRRCQFDQYRGIYKAIVLNWPHSQWGWWEWNFHVGHVLLVNLWHCFCWKYLNSKTMSKQFSRADNAVFANRISFEVIKRPKVSLKVSK